MIKVLFLDLYGVVYPQRIEETKILVKSLRDFNIAVFAVTNLAPSQGTDICRLVGIEHLYSSQALDMSKTQPEFYQYIVKDSDLFGAEITLVDDTCSNLFAARQAGLKTIYFGADICPSADFTIKSLNELVDLVRG